MSNSRGPPEHRSKATRILSLISRVTLAWQVSFLVIARDPMRFRPLMPVSWIEKMLYPCRRPVVWAGRTRVEMASGAMLDLEWLALLVIAWTRGQD